MVGNKATPQRARARRAGGGIPKSAILAAFAVILAAVALPTAKHSIKRGKEMELRRELRQMRNAIDEFKRYSDAGLIAVELGTDGYPSELEILVEGVEVVGQIDKSVRFLRRIPVDPMTGEAEWGLRSFQDDFDSDSWGGENVFDVYSLSEGVGLNGVPYREW